MKVLAIIPARSGSKGIKDKNIQLIGGKTLIEWCLILKEHKQISEIIISTDSKKYEKIALNNGAISVGLRSKEFSYDNSKSYEIINDLSNKGFNLSNFTHIILLQPTFPFRLKNELDEIINLSKKNDGLSVVSVSKLEDPHPFKLKKINNSGFVTSFFKETSSETPRQQLPDAYKVNGGYYFVKIDHLLSEETFLPLKTLPFHMETRVNIDNEEDLEFARFFYENNWVKRKKK